MKKELCSIPECGRPVEYVTLKLCKRCYQRRWYQVEIAGRAPVATKMELAIKSLMEATIDNVRKSADEIESGRYELTKSAKMPASDYVVTLRIVTG